MKIVGCRIVYLLKKQGITQKEFSKRIGISESTMSRYAKGTLNPKKTTLEKIAVELGTTQNFLTGNDSLNSSKHKIDLDKFIEWLKQMKRESEIHEEKSIKRRDYFTAMDERSTIETYDFIIEQLTDLADENDFWED